MITFLTSPKAFTGHLQPFERIDPRLVALAGPVPGAAFSGTATEAADLFENRHPPTASLTVPGVSSAALHGNAVRLMDGDAGQFVNAVHREGSNLAMTTGRIAGETVVWLKRRKEEASDYRYFPEPDLVPVTVDSARLDQARAALGELPAAQRVRLQSQYALSAYDAEVLTRHLRQRPWFTC